MSPTNTRAVNTTPAATIEALKADIAAQLGLDPQRHAIVVMRARGDRLGRAAGENQLLLAPADEGGHAAARSFESGHSATR